MQGILISFYILVITLYSDTKLSRFSMTKIYMCMLSCMHMHTHACMHACKSTCLCTSPWKLEGHVGPPLWLYALTSWHKVSWHWALSSLCCVVMLLSLYSPALHTALQLPILFVWLSGSELRPSCLPTKHSHWLLSAPQIKFLAEQSFQK